MKFPIYIGPYYINNKPEKENDLVFFVKDKIKHVFDIVNEHNYKDIYEDRLSTVREVCNYERPKMIDLPMVRVHDMQEFAEQSKIHLTNKEKGVIFYSAYSNDTQFKTIIFKRSEQND